MDPKRRQLLSYLLLNIVVSACVTVAVMFIYDHYFHSSPEPLLSAGQPSLAGGTAKVEIVTVVGAGIPSSETVLLRNTGDAPAALKGWKLQDEESNLYLFPDVTIISGGSIQLHTAPGDDSLIDLYWGLTAPVWRSGETVTLIDSAGTVRSAYKVP